MFDRGYRLKISKKISVAAVIVSVLMAQGMASFGRTNRYFPFVWYPMYAEARHESDRLVVHHSLYARTADGKSHEVRPSDLAINFWRFERLVVPAIKRSDAGAIKDALNRIRALHPDVKRLELEDYPLTITHEGPRAASKMVVASMVVPGGE